MFIFNFKINGNRTAKMIMGILCVIILLLTVFVCYRVIFNNFFKTNDNYLAATTFEPTSQNYANVLQQVHNDIDTYVGQKIKFVGYVYRLYDFTDEQFVLARDMIVSSDFQTVVVGFLCHSKIASNFENNTWIEVEGTITKGNYYGNMPIIEVESIKETTEPTDEYVYPPDDSFVTTSTVL